MFFTRLGTVAAWLALIMAAGRIGIAIYIITSIPSAEEARAWAARYLGQSPAQAIDLAAIVAACAIALGILAEIGRATHRDNQAAKRRLITMPRARKADPAHPAFLWAP